MKYYLFRNWQLAAAIALRLFFPTSTPGQAYMFE
jgi:hypothetical protein